jgi:hypothetical protein
MQPLEDSRAWAHAQIMGKTGDPQAKSIGSRSTTGRRTFPACFARELTPLRSYLACLVPAFDCGVKAASGLGGGMLRSRLEPCA